MDKRSEGQWPKFDPQDPYDGGEDPFYRWNVENHDEMLNQAQEDEERERFKQPYLSRNAEDIENSKRSRGERL